MSEKEFSESQNNAGNEDEKVKVDFETHFFDSTYISAIINEFEVTKAAEVFQRDVKEVEEWAAKKNLPCKQVLVNDIYPKVKKFVLQDYKDCYRLRMLQDTFAPNPDGGKYAPYLDKLIDTPSEVVIKPCKLTTKKDDFNVLVCQILQEIGKVDLKFQDKPITTTNYQTVEIVVTLTEKGVAYLIRDRIHQRHESDKLDNDSVSKYVSQIYFPVNEIEPKGA